MAGSSDRQGVPRQSPWIVAAGAILALQGIATIVYGGFIPPPITDAGVSVPLLNHLSFVWLVVGGLAIAAAVGVLRRRIWGRYLGMGVETLSIATAFMTNPSLPGVALALVFPGVVLFALWRRWPASGASP